MTVPSTFKQQNVFVAYSPTFQRQSDIGSPLDPDVLTARLPLAREAKPLPTRRVTRDETRDCSGKYLTGRRITSRLALWTLQLPTVTAQLVAGMLAMAFGDASNPTGTGPHTSQITRAVSDQLPATSFIVGATDSDEPAELYSDMVLNGFEFSAPTARQKLAMTANFIGSANVDLIDGFTAPACGTNPVALYPQDCLLTINATDYTDNLRSLLYRFNNNVYSTDDPFPWDAIDVVRLERGVEESLFQFGMYGTKAHPLYALALSEAIEAVSLRIGSATEGTSIISPGAQLTLQDTPVGYAGEASRSVINLDATPFSVSDGLPDHVVAVLAQVARFLTVPA
jgi:hypothetical protein